MKRVFDAHSIGGSGSRGREPVGVGPAASTASPTGLTDANLPNYPLILNWINLHYKVGGFLRDRLPPVTTTDILRIILKRRNAVAPHCIATGSAGGRCSPRGAKISARGLVASLSFNTIMASMAGR